MKTGEKYLWPWAQKRFLRAQKAKIRKEKMTYWIWSKYKMFALWKTPLKNQKHRAHFPFPPKTAALSLAELKPWRCLSGAEGSRPSRSRAEPSSWRGQAPGASQPGCVTLSCSAAAQPCFAAPPVGDSCWRWAGASNHRWTLATIVAFPPSYVKTKTQVHVVPLA